MKHGQKNMLSTQTIYWLASDIHFFDLEMVTQSDFTIPVLFTTKNGFSHASTLMKPCIAASLTANNSQTA
jgi:hypothetical protein